MRAQGYMTGMLGVYLTAAELTKLGFIVSPTSRSAFGADLLVTDQRCHKAWSVQVKTNRRAATFWLLSAHVADAHSESHVYVFLNIRGEARPDYFVVPSMDVTRIHKVNTAKTGSVWYFIDQKDMGDYAEGWSKVFGHSTAPSR
jgi:hypothetical protein